MGCCGSGEIDKGMIIVKGKRTVTSTTVFPDKNGDFTW